MLHMYISIPNKNNLISKYSRNVSIYSYNNNDKELSNLIVRVFISISNIITNVEPHITSIIVTTFSVFIKKY